MRLSLTWSPVPWTLASRLELHWVLDHNCVREIRRGDEINGSPFSLSFTFCLPFHSSSHHSTICTPWGMTGQRNSKGSVSSQLSIHEKRPWARPAVKNVSQEWKTRSRANLNIVSFILIQWVPPPGHATILTGLSGEMWCQKAWVKKTWCWWEMTAMIQTWPHTTHLLRSTT